jgi:sterol 3beta-glucosyltransferase
MVALADRLRREGHEVVLAAPPLFKPLAIACQVPFAPLDIDMLQVGEAMAGSHGMGHFARLARTLGGLVETALASAWDAARDSRPDVIIHHPVLPLGQHIAERLGVPAVLALPVPALVPTGRFPSPIWSSTACLPGPVNRATYRAATLQLNLWSCSGVDRWRAAAGLPRLRRGGHDPLRSADHRGTPVLHGFSEHVLPRPDDWPDTAQVCGYWSMQIPPEWSPPRKLAAFLDAGDPPVYVGFGSMTIDDPPRLGAMIEEVAERLGTRAVLALGYHSLRGLKSSERILVIRHAPHDWLFPRVSAVVHHGGAGTCGAAAVAGSPQVICPVGTDQPFWADQLRRLGVGLTAPPLRAMTSSALEVTLRRVIEDSDLRNRATALGGLIQAEDGPGRAVALLEQVVAGFQQREQRQRTETTHS